MAMDRAHEERQRCRQFRGGLAGIPARPSACHLGTHKLPPTGYHYRVELLFRRYFGCAVALAAWLASAWLPNAFKFGHALPRTTTMSV